MDRRAQEIEQRGLRLPFGIWAGPVLWGLQILVGYGLATVSCRIGNSLPVLLAIGISGLIVLAAAVIAYSAWRTWPGEKGSILLDANQEGRTNTFLAVAGFAMSSLFFLLILATFLTDLFLSPCPIITMPLP